MKTSKRPEAQGSLTSYWARSSSNITLAKRKPTPATVPELRDKTFDTLSRLHPSSSEPPSDAQDNLLSLRLPPTSRPGSSEGSSAARQAPPTRAPMLPIPQPLSSHKLRPIPNTTRPRFNTDEELHSKKDYVFLSSSPPKAQEEADVTKSPLKSKGIEQENNTPSQAAPKYNDSRPAATFHKTSLAQVQAATTVQKKTLGVRRSMNGWSSRGGHGFSVPGRARQEP